MASFYNNKPKTEHIESKSGAFKPQYTQAAERTSAKYGNVFSSEFSESLFNQVLELTGSVVEAQKAVQTSANFASQLHGRQAIEEESLTPHKVIRQRRLMA